MSKAGRELFGTMRRRLRGTHQRRPAPDPDPVYPEVVETRTNVGPHMDALVAEAKRKQRPVGVDPDYDLLRENFDHLEYLLQASALEGLPDGDPIARFLRQGHAARSTPHHNFSMSNYTGRYPEKKAGPERSPYLEWIKRGRAAGEIADPAHGIEQMAPVLGLEPHQMVDELVATRDDVMQRLWTGRLGTMIAKAAEIEPLIAAAWPETIRLRQLPLHAKQVAAGVSAIHACQEAAEFRTARVLMVTAGPTVSEGLGPAVTLARGLTEAIAADDIVVIYTDQGGEALHDQFPEGVREVDFASVTARIPEEIKQLALTSLLRSFRADSIVNLDSELMYQALEPYGKALAASERLFLHFTGNQQQVLGNWDGWSLRWFYAGMDLLTGIITASEELRAELVDRHQLSDDDRDRIHVLGTAAEPAHVAALLLQDTKSPEAAR